MRGRRPGISESARPSSSRNICARVPRQKPRPGIAGELCSQPPLGVAETRLPWRSATSTWQVSPSVGSPSPGPPAVDRLAGLARRRAPRGRPAPRRSVGVLAAEQPVQRHGRAVAVVALAVLEGELRALHHGVDVLGAEELAEVDALEQRELLEEHRPLPPGAGLADRPAGEAERRPGPRPWPRSARGPSPVEEAVVVGGDRPRPRTRGRTRRGRRRCGPRASAPVASAQHALVRVGEHRAAQPPALRAPDLAATSATRSVSIDRVRDARQQREAVARRSRARRP